jgi:hypothetical protein
MRANLTVRLTKAQKKFSEEIGRIGGRTRAQNLSAAERRTIAIKASEAAAKARTQKAQERKARNV